MTKSTAKAPIDIAFLQTIPTGTIMLMIDACAEVDRRRSATDFPDWDNGENLDSKDCCPADAWDAMLELINDRDHDPKEYDAHCERARQCHLTPRHLAHELEIPHLASELERLHQILADRGHSMLYRQLEKLRPGPFRERLFGADLGL